MSLTKGSIKAIVEKNDRPSKFVVQVLNVTGNKDNKPQMRCKMLTTDGESAHYVFLTLQLNPMVEDGMIKKFSVISITNYQVTNNKDNITIVAKDVKLIEQRDEPVPGVTLNSDNSVSFQSSSKKRKPEPVLVKTDPISSKQNVSSKNVSQATVQKAFVRSPSPSDSLSLPSEMDDDEISEMDVVEQNHPKQSVVESKEKQPEPRKLQVFHPAYKATYTLVPITALTPCSRNWTITARVTSKSALKEWANERGSGSVFSVDLLDALDEIKATFYKDAANKFFDLLVEGKVYSFAAGTVRNVDKKSFTRLTNPYELVFHGESIIKLMPDDNSIKTQLLNLVKIRNLGDYSKDSLVDVAVVVRGYGEVGLLNVIKSGDKQHFKRELTVVDDTQCEIRLTLWAEHANMKCDWASHPILVLKGARVLDYQGRGLSTTSSSIVQLNPFIPEVDALREVQEALLRGDFHSEISLTSAGGGMTGDLSTTQLLNRVDIGALKTGDFLAVNLPEKGVFVTTKATITHIKYTGEISYCACPAGGCGRKVTPVGETGMWACSKCNKEYSECNRRFVLYLTLSDHSGGQIVTMHNDVAEKLLGQSAQQLQDLKMSNYEGYCAVIANATFVTFLCRIKVHKEVSQDQERVKCTLMGLSAVNLDDECEQMDAAVCFLMETMSSA